MHVRIGRLVRESKSWAWMQDQLAGIGDFYRFVVQTGGWTLRNAFTNRNTELVLPQAYLIGVRSVTVVGLTGGFIGLILAVETVTQFRDAGLEDRIGAVLSLTVIRELGPTLGAIMLAGRVGGALTAELGTMNVTEQLDALRVMGSDPIRHLVVPRVLACMLLAPLLVMVSVFMAVSCGAFMTVHVFGVSSSAYWDYAREAVENFDLIMALLKGWFFGLALGLIACYKGFRTRGGAEGVGAACTEAFVLMFLAILFLDLLLNLVLKGVYTVLFGPKLLI